MRVAPGIVALLVSTGGLALLLRALRRPDPEVADLRATVADSRRLRGSVAAEESVDRRGGRCRRRGAGRTAAGISAIDRPDRPGWRRADRARAARRDHPGPAARLRRATTGAGFLHAAGAVGTLGVAGAIAWRAFSIEPGLRLAAGRARPLVPTDVAKTVAGADFKIPNLTPYFTPTKDFYRVDTSIIVPRVDARKWRLRIHGMVENPIELSYGDLMGRKMIERDITLACVSNEIGGDLTGNARWVGARIDEILREARPLPAANAVKSTPWTGGRRGPRWPP